MYGRRMLMGEARRFDDSAGIAILDNVSGLAGEDELAGGKVQAGRLNCASTSSRLLTAKAGVV